MLFGSDETLTREIIQLMTPRQLLLNQLYAWFECSQYANRKMDWSGTERLDALEFESVAAHGYIPDGFQVITQNEELPLKFRKPTAPYHLPRVVIERFTAMLFSERRHPMFDSETEPETADWTNAAAQVGRLWPTMIKARNYGGGTGTAIIGFAFVNGKPKFESHDPRWSIPTFSDQQELSLVSLEKKYPYPKEEWNAQASRYDEVLYWYRRVIDEQYDTVYAPLPDKVYRAAMKKGDAVPWIVKSQIRHGFGECPVEWIHNIGVDGAVDGEPDCAAIFDVAEAIDMLYAQAHSGTVANCDPTLLLKTDAELGDVSLGHKNVLKLNQGDDGKFLEIQASGIKAARELAGEFRERALEVVSCVLDNNDVGDRATATEVERIFSAMLAKCDILREQYGVKGVVPLMQKMLRAARKLSTTVIPPTDPTQLPQRRTVTLPPKVEKLEDGSTKKTPRTFGTGDDLVLKWGPYFIPSLNDTKQAADAAAVARSAKVIDQETATRFTAAHFGVDDPTTVLQNLEREREQDKQDAEDELERELAAQVQVKAATEKPAPKKAAGDE